jgi:carbon monoxide dehydrogenase subunit G
MAKTMPGVESFEIADDKHWSAKVKVPLGLGGLKMSMQFTKLEERPLEFASLNAKGTGVGALMNMTTSFTLSGEGDTTSMAWEADVKIAGPVGSMGQRVLQPIVNQQVQHVLAALDEQVQKASSGGSREPGDAGGSGSGAAGGEKPSTEVPSVPAGELDDYGEPAESSPDPEPETGTSGADEGVSPLAPETYEPEPEGPTTSTED